jgi:cytochrome P450
MTSEVSDSRDVFALFEAAHGAGVVLDPYPKWAEQRAESPVHEGDLDPMAGESALFGDRPVYTVLGFDAATEVLRDSDRFSTDIFNDVMGPVLGRVILGMNPVDHRLHRGLVQEAFSRRVMRDWMPNIEAVVDAHVAAFEDRGHADLVSELTFSFPVFVIAKLLGLPEEDLPSFHRWSVEMICLPFDPELGLAGSAKLAEYFAPLVAARRAEPRDDLISVLASAQLEGRSLEDQEIVDFLRFLLEAGAETTYRSSSNLLFGLLTNPGVLDEVRSNRDLLPQAIEEALRWEPPLTMIFRGAARDTELAGVRIPEGAVVAVNIGAADRDESRWENPDVFDIHRPPLAHHAFGFGAHICLGMHLARAETMAALDAVLDRLPNLRLDPAAGDVHITGSTFRAPVSLPVVFDRR